MIMFNVAAWYWKNDAGQIYSSASSRLVGATDQTFAAWTKNGGIPTVWPRDGSGAQTPASLSVALTFYNLPAFAG